MNFNAVVGKEEGECELNDATAKEFPVHLQRTLIRSTYSVPNDPG